MRWYERPDRACAGRDTDLFDPRTRAGELAAKAFCARCPVRQPCLEDELAIEGGRGASGRYYIRGGLTPRERARLARGLREAG